MNKKLLYFLCCLSIPLLVQAVYTADFLPWASWYPVERGLAEGERAYNWWIRDTGDPFNEYYQGQSTWNYPGTPPYFPETFNSNTVNYVINWQCNRMADDPRCEDWDVYRELMSEGTASGDNSYLEHWSRGGRGLNPTSPISWEVYYDPAAFVSCDSATVAATGDAYLQQTDIKAPFVMRLPDTIGEEFTSPVVCTVIFDDFIMAASHIRDGRTAAWFVVNRILEQTTEGDGTNILKAENLYFADINSGGAGLDSWCAQTQNSAYCEQVGENWQAQTRTQESVTGKLFAYEQYWMREVPAENPLINGFGAFRWGTWPTNQIEYDDQQVWGVTTCSENNGQINCIYPYALSLPFVTTK